MWPWETFSMTAVNRALVEWSGSLGTDGENRARTQGFGPVVWELNALRFWKGEESPGFTLTEEEQAGPGSWPPDFCPVPRLSAGEARS